MSYWEYAAEDEALKADSLETDSAYEDGRLSEIYTLSSTTTEYRYENGRRYHRYHEGQYAFPNDQKERDRLDLQHHILGIMFGGKLHFSPIKEDGKIIDVGVGTGIWAIDMAEMYPLSEVIGTDLSKVQPSWQPPNCKFEVDDCELEWMFPNNYFELVHARYLNGSITSWPHLFQQAYEHMNPGGFIELHDAFPKIYCDDNTLSPDSPITCWFDLVKKAAAATGRPFEDCANFKHQMIKAGFEDIQEKVFKLPCNAWAKDEKMKNLGRHQCVNIMEGLEGWSMALFTRVLGWEQQEVLDYLVDVRKAFRSRSVHAYWKMLVVWGRKPETKN